MKQLIPTLWFDGNITDIATYYTSVFSHGKIIRTDYYSEAGKEVHGHEPGDELTVEFEIEGQTFLALNGGSQFNITPAVSFSVFCQDVSEVERLWNELSDGGSILMPLNEYPFSQRYGWIQDKYGVSWQLSVAEEKVDQKIAPSLLFTGEQTGRAEDALLFYTDVFPESSISTLERYDAGQPPNQAGTIMYGEASLSGYALIAMDSALKHNFNFTPGISLVITCDSQEEVDHFWTALSAVPEAEACGWLTDRFGVSWQVVPKELNTMLENGTPEQVERVMAALMDMKKLDIATLKRAYDANN